MLYQSLRFTNGIWVLAELKVQPGNPVVQASTCEFRVPKGILHVGVAPIPGGWTIQLFKVQKDTDFQSIVVKPKRNQSL